MSVAPSEAWIRSVLDPLLDAIELLHREEVYHRDIAPDNVLLPPGQAPVLLDFGAARHAIGDQTHTFTAILKPSYAPIEQYAEAVQLRQGPWTDLYALGAVIHYLLRGEPPPPATARAVQDDVLVLAPHDNPGVSPQFLAAVEWALAIRPGERPQQVGALRAVLEGRAAVPPRPRSHTTQPGGTTAAPPAEATPFSTTLPWRDPALQPTAGVPARPITAPQRLPLSAFATPRPESTVMPATPTQEPRRLPRRPLWALAGAGGALAIAAVAWTLGGGSAATPDIARPPAVFAPESPAADARRQDNPLPVAAAADNVMPAQRGATVTPAQVTDKPVRSADPPRLPARRRSAPPSDEARPAGPREACGSRRFIALARCMEEQCGTPRFNTHPQCVKVREIIQRRRQHGEAG